MLSRLFKGFSTPCYQIIFKGNPQILQAHKLSRQFSSKLFPETIHHNSKEEDKEELNLKAQNDPNKFGSLSVQIFESSTVSDAGDLEEEKYLENPPQKSQQLRTKQYADMIKEHLRNKRMKEAIDVLEIRMIKEDRVKPENYIFNLVIGACGRTGYSKKAFQLYNQMKQRNLKITGGTYTALFNACAMSPWPQDGLEKANHLRQIMHEKGYEPNDSNYNAMIKAFGRCGDLELAFQMVDEMKTKGWQIQIDTFNFLLQACISDKELGFRHALVVWHKMHQRNRTPDIFSFNLMLRCVRDCGIGDVTVTENVIKMILSGHLDALESQPLQLTADGKQEKDLNEHVTFVELNAMVETTPNLLAKQPHLGTLVSIGEITKPEDRLVLLGGSQGFLTEMELAHVTPDIKTFTELLDVIPPTLVAEKVLLSTLRKKGLKCDIDFFNILIKKRSMRFDYLHAKVSMS
jgi:pentatricopeptide repeat domain-containing protein 1